MAPRTPLYRPREYFERHPDPIVPWLGAFGVYLAASAVFSYAVVRLFFSRIENLPPEGRRALDRALPEAMGRILVILLVVALVSLLVVAAVVHLLSGGSGDGSFADAAAVAGWAYAPDALSLPVKYAVAWYHVRDVTLDGSDPAALAARAEQVEALTGPVDALLALVVVGWSVYVLAYGVAGTHDLDVSETAGAAVLVGIGSLLLRLA